MPVLLHIIDIEHYLEFTTLFFFKFPSLLSLTTGGIICVSLRFHHCDPPTTPKKMMGKKTFLVSLVLIMSS